MNKIQTEAFLSYYNGDPIDAIRRKLHKSEKTINKWVIEFEFDKRCIERSQQILDRTANESTAIRLDILDIIKNSISRTYTQYNVFGDPCSSIPIESAKDLQSLADVITKLDGTGLPAGTVINMNDSPRTVEVSDETLREIGRKLATEAANE